MGQFTIAFNFFLILLQVILRRKEFEKIQYLQIAASLLFGYFLDFSMSVISWLTPEKLSEEDGEGRKKGQESIMAGADTGTKWIITIGREYGCGAAKIGKIVAEKLGINCYDSELVDMVAAESGLEAEYVLQNQEKLANGFLYDLYKQTYAYTNGEQTRADAMHDAEAKVIRKITEKESCVIIGRMANYVLEGHENAFHVFLYAPMEYKKQQVMEREYLSGNDAECRIRKVEQERSNCYRQYAKKDWGRANSYDLTVNTGLYDPEKTADIIIGMLKASSKNTQQTHDATVG